MTPPRSIRRRLRTYPLPPCSAGALPESATGSVPANGPATTMGSDGRWIKGAVLSGKLGEAGAGASGAALVAVAPEVMMGADGLTLGAAGPAVVMTPAGTMGPDEGAGAGAGAGMACGPAGAMAIGAEGAASGAEYCCQAKYPSTAAPIHISQLASPAAAL